MTNEQMNEEAARQSEWAELSGQLLSDLAKKGAKPMDIFYELIATCDLVVYLRNDPPFGSLDLASEDDWLEAIRYMEVVARERRRQIECDQRRDYG